LDLKKRKTIPAASPVSFSSPSIHEFADTGAGLIRVAGCQMHLKKGAERLKTESMIEIAIFPSGNLRRPKKKLETIKRFWRGWQR